MTDDSNHPLRQRALRQGAGHKAASARKARKLAKRSAAQMPVVEQIGAPQRVRVVDAPLVSPAPDGGLLGVLQRPWLLRLLVRREMAKRYAASLLGLLWSYVQPGIRFAVYYFVVAGLIKANSNVPQFAIHVFCGIVFTHYFTETFSGGTRSIWQNRSLIGRTALPREVFPIASMLTAAIHTLPQLVLLGVICGLVGWQTDLEGVASGLLGLAIIVTFGTALALLFSAINVYYRDFQNVVSTVTQFTHFLVPMIYPISRVLAIRDTYPVIYQIYMANPVADAVILLQRFFWDGVVRANGEQGIGSQFPPHMLERGLITLVVCLLLLWLSQKAFRRLESKFPERIRVKESQQVAESIVVDNVSKVFTMHYHRTLKQIAVATARRLPLSESFQALSEVTFTVEQGESIGLMGLNGSGKSTLLKLISGVMQPDGGTVRTRGRIAGLIAKGAGFHPQLTGRENLYLNAAILGLSEAQTDAKFDEIVDFADVGRFLDVPVSHYSSGMYARLGFSVAVHVDADVFLADEVLAVGDRPFKKKCMEKMQEIRLQGTTIFYVSHAAASVRKMCDRVLVLESGHLNFDGDVDEGIRFLHYDSNFDDDEQEEEDEELGSEV